MVPIPLFVELCAGLASFSRYLQHGKNSPPPISRMGRKWAYCEAIAKVMGLRPRQGAERYLWAEADSDVAALLAAYTQPEVMRQIAEIIRSWIPCPAKCGGDSACLRCKGTGRWDARDLWETLRKEKRRGLWEGGGSATDAAAWGWLQARSVLQKGPTSGYMPSGDEDGSGRWVVEREGVALALDRAALPWPPVLIANRADVDPLEVAGWLNVCARSDTINHFAAEEDVPREGRPTGGGWRGNGPGREGLAERCITQVWPPVLIAQDARIEPGEVAGWMGLAQGSYRRGQPESGFDDEEARGRRSSVEVIATDLQRGQVWPPVHLTPDATIQPSQIPAGTVVYMDGPYENTTGYKHTFGRDEQIKAALRWHAAGARVYISEAEPLPLEGWHHVDIGGERKGQSRTFSRSSAEWLTCSHPPAWTPPKQARMF